MRALNAQVLFLLVTALFGVGSRGYGFPEMVRHNYVNCTTCHVSPNGGGTLTKYGRGLSEEILSTWHKEGEGQFAWGAIKTPDWLMAHGDFRYLQSFMETPASKDARFVLMQNDLEAAAQVGKFTVDASLGYNDKSGDFFDHVISRRHYVMYQATEKIAVRAGRFLRSFGINNPDHYITTKQGLGMDQGQETYNLEASFIGEKYDLFVTGVFGRLDNSSVQSEKGFAIRSSMGLGDSYKVGLSYALGTNDKYTRHLFGPYAILGFTPHLYAMVEADLRNLKQPKTADSNTGLFTWARFGWEFYQGVHVYAQHQYQQAKFGDGLGTPSYGGGFLFYPRPHFEFQSVLQHTVLPQGAGSVQMLALLGHLYL